MILSDIDIEMRPIIKTLNEKGYETIACCQGHWNDTINGYFDTYIYFKNPITDHCGSLRLNARRSDNKTKGENRYYNRKGKIIHFNGSTYKTMSRIAKDREHDELIKELTDWANGLEQYG